MSSVRLLRLQADYESVRRLVHLHPKISIDGVVGKPPERYRLFLNVRSLRQHGQELAIVNQHQLEIRLPQGYPRDAPVCRLLTPIFHPNIAPHIVCIGDHWTAAESLDRVIMRICEIVAFQSYNTKSPLNGEASEWVENNIDQLPIDRDEFFFDFDISQPATTEEQTQTTCGNCQSPTQNLAQCAAGHYLCAECVMYCEQHTALLCLICGSLKCKFCYPVSSSDDQLSTH